jgi:hypothetical protein
MRAKTCIEGSNPSVSATCSSHARASGRCCFRWSAAGAGGDRIPSLARDPLFTPEAPGLDFLASLAFDAGWARSIDGRPCAITLASGFVR